MTGPYLDYLWTFACKTNKQQTNSREQTIGTNFIKSFFLTVEIVCIL